MEINKYLFGKNSTILDVKSVLVDEQKSVTKCSGKHSAPTWGQITEEELEILKSHGYL